MGLATEVVGALPWARDLLRKNSVAEEFITRSETRRLGRELFERLQPPMLVLLTGDFRKDHLDQRHSLRLGAARITSPTFTLVHVYGKPAKVYHADLYRIESFHDFETLGMEDMFATPSVAILSASERFPPAVPWPQVRIHLDSLGGDARRITVL